MTGLHLCSLQYAAHSDNGCRRRATVDQSVVPDTVNDTGSLLGTAKLKLIDSIPPLSYLVPGNVPSSRHMSFFPQLVLGYLFHRHQARHKGAGCGRTVAKACFSSQQCCHGCGSSLHCLLAVYLCSAGSMGNSLPCSWSVMGVGHQRTNQNDYLIFFRDAGEFPFQKLTLR